MPIRRAPRSDPLPPRWRRVVTLLQQQAMTMAELAEALGVTPKTARTYLSEASKSLDIDAAGPWGQTRYWIKAGATEPAPLK